MFEDSNHYSDELDLAIEESESDSSSASTTDENDGEESDDSLDLDESSNKESAEAVRKRTIAVWQARVDTGEVTLDQIPHAWIRKEIVAKEKPAVDMDMVVENIDKLVEKKLAEREDKNRFTKMLDEVKSIELSSIQRQDLAQEYQDFRANGMSQSVALEKAMKVVGIESPEIRRMKELRASAVLPKGGRGGKIEQPNAADPAKIKNPEDRLKFYESLRQKRG